MYKSQYHSKTVEMISDQGSPGVIDRVLDPFNSTLFNQNQDKKMVLCCHYFLILIVTHIRQSNAVLVRSE